MSKKSEYHRITPASVSFFEEVEIFCVSFFFVTQWFSNEKEATDYAQYLRENFFFINFPDKIAIKKYRIMPTIYI